MSELVAYTTYLPKRLKRAFKVRCAEHDVAMVDILEALIQAVVDGDDRIMDFLEEKFDLLKRREE